MFKIFELGNWQGVGGDSGLVVAKDGRQAVEWREAHGLPAEASGQILIRCGAVTDRRAAESWPEALDHNADLPVVTAGARRQQFGEDCEVADMVSAKVLTFGRPAKFKVWTGQEEERVGLELELAVSPFELVQWRRAWAAEREAKKLRAEVARLEKRVEELEAEGEE